MSYTVEDYKKDFVREHFDLLSPDEVLNRYSPEERIKNLSPDVIINSLSPEYLKVLLEKLGKMH